jgi:hypothetical protein
MKVAVFGRIAFCSLILMGSLPVFASAQGNTVSVAGFAGVGRKDSPTRARDIQLGLSLSGAAVNRFVGFELEGGYLGPSSFSDGGSGLFSVSYRPVWRVGKVFPFGAIGYSRLKIGNALNVGGGIDYFPSSSGRIGLRVEVRDYVVVHIPTQFPAVRAGIVFTSSRN